ncbi:MAG: hypothetical protein JW990_11750, partial [Thermoleophilia bacterium]|nr:hypothetical protein [Thermoleophilia bacterium]
ARVGESLTGHLIMWEAQWTRVRRREKRNSSTYHTAVVIPSSANPPARRDPVVLRPLEPGSDLAVVVATWELTALEQAALESLGGPAAGFPGQ